MTHQGRSHGGSEPAGSASSTLDDICAQVVRSHEMFLAEREAERHARRAEAARTSTPTGRAIMAQPLPLEVMSSLKTSARVRKPGGVCGSVMIASVHCRAAPISPPFHAESANSSRALCRNVRSGAVKGSSRARMSPYEALSTSR